MRKDEDWVDLLESFLLKLDGDETMIMEELDGFLTGVIVCPALIMPSLWLPRIWSLTGDPSEESVFEDDEEMNSIIGMIMLHFNSIVMELRDERALYEPLLSIDNITGDILWECWAEGFGRAMAIAPNSWNAIMTSDDAEASAALAGLRRLADFASDERVLPLVLEDRLHETAPGLIGPWVEALNAWRISYSDTAAPPLRAASGKAGRNDPCPCGSGRKYKKCCLN